MLVVPESASERHGQEAVNQVNVCDDMLTSSYFNIEHNLSSKGAPIHEMD